MAARSRKQKDRLAAAFSNSTSISTRSEKDRLWTDAVGIVCDEAYRQSDNTEES